MASPPSFRADIRPLFRQKDLDSMSFAFDLSSYEEVSDNASVIIRRLRTGTMPCDGGWPKERVDLFAQWIETGKKP